jgi:colicin import membrane protein
VPQEQISSIAAREKDEGRRAAEKAIAEKLGVTVDEAAQIIADAKARDEAQLSEAQKAQKRAEAEAAKAANAIAKASELELQLKVKLALISEGVPAERLDAVSRLVDATTDADEKAIAGAVSAAKQANPWAFEESAAAGDGGEGEKPPAKKPPASDPPGKPPAKPKGGEGAYDRGLELAKSQFSGGGGSHPLVRSE